ncbi:hypothetical protein BD779DRAFT_1465738 [Infundibulicybe gibba]|nr:hypothetical protein BD779DRAFT_1465738 [Infundibulicybe gibba]
MDPAASKFHEALPYVLLHASPRLAALHRSRTKNPSFPVVDCCNKCGSYLFTGDAGFRSIRPKRKRRKEAKGPNILQIHCHICGDAMSLPLEKEQIAQPVEPTPTGAAIKQTVTTTPTVPKTSTKKSKLQAMLLKNREKEQIERARKNAHSSQLAAFLSTLP